MELSPEDKAIFYKLPPEIQRDLTLLERLVLKSESLSAPTWKEEGLQIGRFGHQQFAKKEIVKSIDPTTLERLRQKTIYNLYLRLIEPPSLGRRLMEEILSRSKALADNISLDTKSTRET